MRISCVQVPQIWNDIDTAFSRADDAMQRLSENSDMVVFCEQYATGWRTDETVEASGNSVKEMWREFAEKHGVAVVGSYQKEISGKQPQNVMLVLDPKGKVLCEYAKIHLFTPGGEDRRFSAGNLPAIFEYGGVKFGCAVCYDLRFPELFREYLHLGCECVIVQAAWPAARVSDWELLLRARALENRGFVAGCGCLGYDGVMGTDYAGRSMICDPEGRIVSDAGVFEGECSFAMDIEVAREWREKWGMK